MSSPSRAMQRKNQRLARKQVAETLRGPATGAGAVDLGSMAGGDIAKQMEVAEDILRQQGFICTCGQRFHREGIAAIGYNLGRFPDQKMVMTKNGPQVQNVVDDGAQFFAQSFCSKSCPDYLDALKNGIPAPEGAIRPKIKAIRLLPAVEWLDEYPHNPFDDACP